MNNVLRGYFTKCKKKRKGKLTLNQIATKIYIITQEDATEAFTSIRKLTMAYPNIPYYPLYRRLLKDNSYSILQYSIKRITLS